MKNDYIYIIYDPTFKSQYFYIGKSINPNKRLKQHLQPSKLFKINFKSNWLRSIIKCGVLPQTHIICKIPNYISWQDAERQWIMFMKWCNIKLTNYTEGGDGGAIMCGVDNPFYGKTHSEENKKIMSKLKQGKYIGGNNPFYGKQHTKETKEKISIANKNKNPWNKGLTITEETKCKISKKLKGRTVSDETKNKIRISCAGINSKICPKQVIEIKKLYSSGLYTHRVLAKMFNVGKTTISYLLSGKSWKYLF